MPLGYHQPRQVDVRILASTNRDLKAEVEAGRFRQDLFFRINVFSLTIPPLRERTGDIAPLAEFFLSQFCSKLNRRVGPLLEKTQGFMESYAWPGNVRELQNEIERMVLLAEPGKPLGPELLSDHIRQLAGSPRGPDGNMKVAIQRLEEEMIGNAMRQFKNNKSRMARNLGISRQALIEKLKRMSQR